MKADDLKSELKIATEAAQYLDSLDGELELKDLIKVSALFSPQRRTSILENELRETNGWEKVKPSLNKGDYLDKDGKYFELKTSATNKNGCINFDQIRPWQQVDYYHCIYWDLENPEKSKAYDLSKQEMLNEVKRLGSASHGTKTANSVNQNIEYSIHLPIENSWDGKYRSGNGL